MDTTTAAPAGAWLGVLGQTGFTAWVGLKRTGELKAGDVVYQCRRRQAVGSAAGRSRQTARGVPGGRQCRRCVQGRLVGGRARLRRRLRLSHPERAADGLARVAPDGIDLYFDNVGGEQLVAALNAMHIGGHIALCGMISQFDSSSRSYDINRLIEAVLRRVTGARLHRAGSRGHAAEFEQTVAGWLRSGEVENRQTVTDGIDHTVEAFLGMLKGGNVGKALVRLDTDWEV